MASPSDIDAAQLDLVAAPCPNCPPDTRRLWRPTDQAIDALASLLLDLAERGLADEQERQAGKGGAA